MTSIDTHCTPTSAQEPPPVTDRRKAVLICPGCGYESDAATNWIVHTDGDADVFVCPDCETQVATR